MHTCKRCGAAVIELPRDFATLKVVCPACRSEQFVRDYVSDADRLRGAAAQIMQAQSNLRQTRETGVKCGNCGGTTALPADLNQPSFACQYCHTELRVTDYVDARVIAGANLRAGIDAIYRDGQKRRRNEAVVAGIVFAVVLLIVAIVLLMMR